MFKLIKNCEIYAPEYLGKASLLIAGESIAWIGSSFDAEGTLPNLEVIDAEGLILTPGFIDGHVHIIGGGGEGGALTRTPELRLSDMALGGVTAVIGVIGTDDVTRHTASLVAKANGIIGEGASAWVLTGSYQLPLKTLCGGIREDIALIDRIIGVGEIALSDHRSSQPSFEEFIKIAAAARIGGMLSGKSGVVNIHLGDGERGIEYLFRAAEETEIPMGQFVPTHMGRNPALFEQARLYAGKGGYVDFTTSTDQVFLEEGEVKCSKALRILLDDGVPASRISFSSDGQGSMPSFDSEGRMTGLTIGRVTSLKAEFRDSVLGEKIPMEDALRAVSATTADHYKLPRKGHVREGYDADLLLMDKNLELRYVFARGRAFMERGEITVKGTFE
jgi:beta-aspartyl-dipeptidase (metallo-type)